MQNGRCQTLISHSMHESIPASLVRVLVVDDSSFMRKALIHILEADKSIQVVDIAADGEDAVRKVKQLRPDVVLLDIEMPVMDGLTALAHIMADCPTPVLMLSAVNKRDADVAIRSLEQGAIDFIPKPSGVVSYDIDTLSSRIIDQVRAAASVSVHRIGLSLPQKSYLHPSAKATTRTKIIVIGASTGGPTAVVKVLSGLPRDTSAAILVVQHMAPEFIPSFADRLSCACSLQVSVARKGEVISKGQVLVAPGGGHTIIATNDGIKKIGLTKKRLSALSLPSIDCTMESAASAYDNGAMGVLLTGVGSDGALGMKAIKDAGGSTIAQDETTSAVFGMPGAAIKLGCVDKVVPLPKIARTILTMM